jgi:hypothetical protein
MGRPGEGDWWDGAYNQVSGKKDLGKSVSKSAKKNGGVGWDGGSQDSWMSKGQTNRTYYDKNGQQRDMGSLDPFGEHGNAFRQDPKAAKQQDMLRQAGIGPDQAYHLAHAAGITNVNSKGDIKSIIKAHDAAHVSHSEMEDYVGKNSKKGDGEGDTGPTDDPYSPSEKSEEHLQAEADYGDGDFPEMTSAADSYQSAFDKAVAAGREMDSGDYLRQRSDDKKSWVTNRFMPYLSNKNELGRHEQHHAASNAIDRAVEAGVEPPSLSDPMDIYDKMKEDIEDIG